MPNTIPMGRDERHQRARPHIFVVNGDPEFLNLMREILQDEGYNVTTTNYVPTTFEQAVSAEPDVLILDLALGQRAGWDLLEALPADAATTGIPVIVVSTLPGHLERAREEAARYPAFGMLDKPFNLVDLLGLVDAALARG
jgi:DNA-binding response OmpR family regulator